MRNTTPFTRESSNAACRLATRLSGYVYDEIRRLRGLHPDTKVYAVISDMGASGAYYIASAADEIYADKASLVGSIGVSALAGSLSAIGPRTSISAV